MALSCSAHCLVNAGGRRVPGHFGVISKSSVLFTNFSSDYRGHHDRTSVDSHCVVAKDIFSCTSVQPAYSHVACAGHHWALSPSVGSAPASFKPVPTSMAVAFFPQGEGLLLYGGLTRNRRRYNEFMHEKQLYVTKSVVARLLRSEENGRFLCPKKVSLLIFPRLAPYCAEPRSEDLSTINYVFVAICNLVVSTELSSANPSPTCHTQSLQPNRFGSKAESHFSDESRLSSDSACNVCLPRPSKVFTPLPSAAPPSKLLYMTGPWSASRRRSCLSTKMLLSAAVFVGLLSCVSAISALESITDDVMNDAILYRQMRLEHMRRHRRQGTPKEISIQVTAPLFSSRLFDYGSEAGDQELPSGLDVGKRVDLRNPLRFNSDEHESVYVLSNGGIGFDSNSRSYRSNIFSKSSNSIPLLAPFWNRNDLRNGGHVWYREITAGRILERGQSEIRYQYDKNVKVLSALIVTWEKMQPLGNEVLRDENTNTFQAAFFMTANYTYANFIYSNIGWTQGAEAGFTPGPVGSDFSLPTSGTGNIMYLEEYGNTGIPGEWMFELQPQRVVRCKVGIKGDTCDEECSHGEYGEDCAQCCHCAGGATCNPLTGVCPDDLCADCYFGPTCRSKTSACDEKDRNACARNAIGYFSTNKCGEQVIGCNCLQGYAGDGRLECTDIDECQQPGTCHENAVCTNTPGHFLCQCIEGYTGDGVTECLLSFFYPSDDHQALPKGKNAKVAWQLKRPMQLFGAPRERITVTTSGLILIEEMSKVHMDDKLEDMNALGVAPFFGAIDLSKGGEITIGEANTADVLNRAASQINENLDQPIFTPTNVVTITYNNVSTSTSTAGNNFQTLLVNGRNKRGQEQTYVVMLFKDLMWSNGAESGIMALEKSNSIKLPGSGTEGIEQLSQLSNVRSPGTWVYRIDGSDIFPCLQLDLQPPYCDAQSPTLVNQRPSATSKQPASSHAASGNIKISNSAEDHVDVASPSSSRTVPPTRTSAKTRPTPTSNVPSVRTRPSTQHQSTQHNPIVSIDPKDFEDLADADDAFDATFPPFITVVPELYTPGSRPKPSSQEAEVETVRPTPPRPPTAPERFTPVEMTQTPPVVKSEKPHLPQFEFANTGNNDVVEFEDTVQTIVPSTMAKEKPTNKPTSAETVVSAESETPSTVVTTPSPSSAETETASSTPLKVFPTTTKAPKASPKKPKVATTTAAPTTTTEDPNVESVAFDQNQILETAESSGTKAAYLIPLAIIGIWIFLLAFIGLCICCRRRRSQHQFHTMYGQNYHVRPIATGFAMRKGSKAFDGSYEDHMEKAARLSSEMSNYNPHGRISLYGSYWNLAGGQGSVSTHATPINGGDILIPSVNSSPVSSAITSATSAASSNTSNGNLPTANGYNLPPQRYGYGAR
uniref:EGF-like domain-containing protein n=1 Tax=Panagrellus redivivus TaxID=6233 RepID=A0A7E4W4K5_PANRE